MRLNERFQNTAVIHTPLLHPVHRCISPRGQELGKCRGKKGPVDSANFEATLRRMRKVTRRIQPSLAIARPFKTDGLHIDVTMIIIVGVRPPSWIDNTSVNITNAIYIMQRDPPREVFPSCGRLLFVS